MYVKRGGKILLFFGKHSMNLWLVHSFFIFYFLNDISFITNNPLVMFITVLGCSFAMFYNHRAHTI